MSAIDVNNEITNMQSQTAVAEAAKTKATGAAQEMDGDMFLKLMMEQLKYQDPTQPMDNTQFLAQQAQFTQVETLQNLSEATSQNNAVMQTLALVGKEVTMTDPNDAEATITGVVDEAVFSSDEASIMVGGKSYPISLIQSVKEATTTASTGN